MLIAKSKLLKQLLNAITDDEWESIQNGMQSVSEFNRQALSNMKATDIDSIPGDLETEHVAGLYKTIKNYLEKYLKDKPDAWKWITVSCIYLACIAERPMHPVHLLDIKEVIVDGKHIYECPGKSNAKNTTCYYCVCKQMSNYEIMKRQMQKEFLKYDQEKIIRKFNLQHDTDHIYIDFIGHKYQIHRTSGKVMWSDDNFIHSQEAEYNEAMTIYDVLCYSKEGCRLSGEFVNMRALASIQSASGSAGQDILHKIAKDFDQKNDMLARACERLNGRKFGIGDVAYQISLFDFLPVVFQFWSSDDEFPASLILLTDKNMLDFMHFETVFFAIGHLMTRLQKEMETMS